MRFHGVMGLRLSGMERILTSQQMYLLCSTINPSNIFCDGKHRVRTPQFSLECSK